MDKNLVNVISNLEKKYEGLVRPGSKAIDSYNIANFAEEEKIVPESDMFEFSKNYGREAVLVPISSDSIGIGAEYDVKFDAVQLDSGLIVSKNLSEILGREAKPYTTKTLVVGLF